MGNQSISMMFVIALIGVMLAVPAVAIEHPLRDPQKLQSSHLEPMVRVKTARVILADYELLRKDFPELAKLSNEEVDRWLLDKTAFVSEAQAKQEEVNTKIDVGDEKRSAHRPVDYGRASVFEAGDSGLIDAKGTGARYNPQLRDHGNGLASLGEAIREFVYERLVRKIFTHSGHGYETVKNYAVIDYGFDIKNADGSAMRAGLVLRQAHERAPKKYSMLDNAHALNIEKSLREYGITSAGAHRNKWPYEWINLQGTSNGAVLDYGGFLSVEKFEKPLIETFLNPTPEEMKPLMTAEEVKKIQPLPELRVPLEIWGSTVSGKADPALDNPSIWSHELANALKEGRATRQDAEQHLRNLLGPVETKLAQTPASTAFRQMNPADGGCANLYSGFARLD